MPQSTGNVSKKLLFGPPQTTKKVVRFALGPPLVLRGVFFVLRGAAKHMSLCLRVLKDAKMTPKMSPRDSKIHQKRPN